MMLGRVVVGGGTGFIGKRLVQRLQPICEEVVIVGRSASDRPGTPAVSWELGLDGAIDGAFAVVNLAGEPISQRWTADARERIVRSRTSTAGAICQAISRAPHPPARWINASAVGFYGDRGSEILDESSPEGHGFLAETCVLWERAVTSCSTPETLKTRARIGMVLGREGALRPLANLARFGLGGPAGSGKQYVSWIHVDDLVELIVWLLSRSAPPEVVNATAPNPVTNGELMRGIRSTMGVPLGLPAPAFAVRAVGKLIGPDSELVLAGSRVVPAAAQSLGFAFAHPQLASALKDVLTRSSK